MRHIILAVTTATAVISSGALCNGAKAADLYPTPEPVPPAAEAPPSAVVAPPPVAVVPQAPAVVLVEPRCPVVAMRILGLRLATSLRSGWRRCLLWRSRLWRSPLGL